MSQKIIPTIGAAVLFNDSNSDQPVPAWISYVHDEDHISIGGFYADGTPFGRVCVPLNHDCDGCELPEHEAGWMLDSMAGDSQEQPTLDSLVNEPESYSSLSAGGTESSDDNPYAAEGTDENAGASVEGSDDVGDINGSAGHSSDVGPDPANPGEEIYGGDAGVDAVENSADSVVTDGGGNEAGEAKPGEAEHGGGL